MPALYGITSNANVSVSNTPGLYIGSGNVLILNSAQTLNTLLSNQGNVNFALTSDNSQVYAYSLVPVFGNANVAAFLPTYLPTYPGVLGFGNYNGSYTGSTISSPANGSLQIGQGGQTGPGNNSIAIGNQAGQMYQGANAVALGYRAGTQYQAANSIIINATGVELDSNSANSFYVAPVRNDPGNVTLSLFYNTVTKEVTYATTSTGPTYGNANVQVYLAANTDPTISNLNANTSQQAAQINTINANIGSFYTYANATYSTIANAASQESEISSLRSNITAANASIQTISANLGSFETYANVTYSTIANAGSLQTQINSTNANVTAANAARAISPPWPGRPPRCARRRSRANPEIA